MYNENKNYTEEDKSYMTHIMNKFQENSTYVYVPNVEKKNFNFGHFFSNFIFQNVDYIYIFSKKGNHFDFSARLRSKEKDYYFILNHNGECFIINNPHIFLPYFKLTFHENEMDLSHFIFSYFSPNNNLKYQPSIILNEEEYKNDDIVKYRNVISKLTGIGFVQINKKN